MKDVKKKHHLNTFVNDLCECRDEVRWWQKKDTDTCTFLQITSVNKTHSK